MIKIGVVGIGRMGSYHLDMYEKLISDGYDIKVVAICDVEPDRLAGHSRHMFNMGVHRSRSMEDYEKYLSVDEMLAKEKLDMVDVVCPTYLHSEIAVKALDAGCHCMCEKPMALNAAQCDDMIAASRRNGRLLMIGQCLHFWREYVFLNEAVKDKRFGVLKGLNLHRGGYANREHSPSWQDWIVTAEKGGGGLFDQHIHDTDFVRWTFGQPESVFTVGKKHFENSANDICATSYIYGDKIITAQDDIAYVGLPFGYGYRADLSEAAIVFDGKLTVYPREGEAYEPDLSEYGISDDAYYNELAYFIGCIEKGVRPERCTPEGAKASVLLALDEAASAEANRK